MDLNINLFYLLKHLKITLFFALIFILVSCKEEITSNEIKSKEAILTHSKFPVDFFGTYVGTLNIHNDKGLQEHPMQFILKATDSLGVYDYTLIYGEGDTYQERKYTMREKDNDKGTFVVDENNGIVLDDKLVGTKLYSLFEVQGKLLTTFITFKEDHLDFEIVFADTKLKNTSFSEDTTPIMVTSYPISVVQKARLRKQ